jgi:hypothetical protein
MGWYGMGRDLIRYIGNMTHTRCESIQPSNHHETQTSSRPLDISSTHQSVLYISRAVRCVLWCVEWDGIK